MQVSGELAYRARIALPPDAVATVVVQDTARADAQAEPLGQADIPLAGSQVPVPFSVPVPTDALTAAGSPTLRATIRSGDGTLLWTTDTVIPVDIPTTGGEAQVGPVNLVQVAATGGESSGDSGEETAGAPSPVHGPWTVTEVDGTEALADNPPTLTFNPDGTVSGSGGCNNLSGTYQLDGEQITIDEPLAVTRKACVPDISTQEASFLGLLTSVSTATVEGSEAMLTLTTSDGATIIARR